MVVCACLGYYLAGNRYAQDISVVLEGDELTLLTGKGEVVRGALWIHQFSDKNVAIVSGPVVRLPARLAPELEWRIDGLEAQTEIRLIWSTNEQPGVVKDAVLLHGGAQTGRLRLAEMSGWQGTITGLGLIIGGELPARLAIRRLALEPIPPDAVFLLAQLWREWTAFEGRQGYSINFIIGGAQDGLLPPVPAAAAWVGLSAVLYVGFFLLKRRPWTVGPLVVFFLSGWLVLDLRWQTDLWRQLSADYGVYAGKNWEARQQAAGDGALFRFIGEIKHHLPAEPQRLFLLSADPLGATNYLSRRAHYHLLPHNVYSFLSEPPDPKRAPLGDYVLVMASNHQVHYDAEQQMLRWGRQNALPVAPLYSAPLGSLFRIEER